VKNLGLLGWKWKLGNLLHTLRLCSWSTISLAVDKFSPYAALYRIAAHLIPYRMHLCKYSLMYEVPQRTRSDTAKGAKKLQGVISLELTLRNLELRNLEQNLEQ